MQKFEAILCQPPQLQRSDDTSNNDRDSIFSEERFTRCESIFAFDKNKKDFSSNTLGTPVLLQSDTSSRQNSFYSSGEEMRIEDSLDDELIFCKKIQKKDIVFKTKHFKESFMRYFVEVIFGFLKQPTQLTFSIALERLKFYDQQNPFTERISQTNSAKQFSSFYSSKSQHYKASFSNIKTVHSLNDTKSQKNSEGINVESLLRQMFYQNEHKFMIYTFDFALCHLTFIASMLYFWSKLDSSSSLESSFFMRTFYNEKINSELNNIKNETNFEYKNNIFKTLKLYISERSQSLNLCQINILLVYFFLNYLKSQFMFQDLCKEIIEIQQIFITKLKMYRHLKRMEKEFNCTQNEDIFQWQLHKYQYGNKLIENMDKTYFIFNFLNTHNFVSSPLEKYYQLHEFESSKRQYHLKRDYFCIWIMSILLRQCEKKSPQSLSKSAFYIIAFLAILKKFKQKTNFEGISLIVPILYNIKEHLPKIWNHAQSRRREINQKLREYSEILTQKIYKSEDILQESKAIINEDLIYEMCSKFTKYTGFDKKNNSQRINLEKHRTFYEEFLSNIIHHRKRMQIEYKEEIDKKDKEIGVSFNMYLLDSYVCQRCKGMNIKHLWSKLTEQCKKTNEQISVSIYADLFDYCFIGSTFKYNQIDI